MPFDPSAIAAPFRMQPGLRRLEDGSPQLHAIRPDDPGHATVLAAKLAVLRHAASQALCVATDRDRDRLNDRVLTALLHQASRDAPQALQQVNGGLQAPLLGWAVEPSGAVARLRAEADDRVGSAMLAVDPPWRRVALCCLAFVEDFALIEAHTTRVTWTAVCLPSHWAPERKVGLPFAAVHAPVADNAVLMKAAAALSRLVAGQDRWERFVWTITPHAGHDAHPGRWPADATAWPATDQADAQAVAERAHFRTERQTFIPLRAASPDEAAALFTIEVGVVPLVDTARGPGGDALGQALHDAIASMSPAVLDYRGLTSARDRLLRWLSRPALVSRCTLRSVWRQRRACVVLLSDFGRGDTFLDLWTAWRRDPGRCDRLHVIAALPHGLPDGPLEGPPAPPPGEQPDGSPAGPTRADAPPHGVDPALRRALQAAWPPATPDRHRLSLDGGAVELLLCPGDLARVLPELDAEVDLFLLEAVDAQPTQRDPASGRDQPQDRAHAQPSPWDHRTCRAMARLASPRAQLRARTRSTTVLEGLRAAGFQAVADAPGAQHGITQAEFAPPFTPRPRPRRGASAAGLAPHALVIGAGLAGCSVVAALAEHGWHSTLVDQEAGPAAQASGNPSGLFHSVVHAQDNPHARFNRACALDLQSELERLWRTPHPASPAPGAASTASAAAPSDPTAAQPTGAFTGLLRLVPAGDLAQMRSTLRRQGLPAGHVRAIDPAEASALAGLPIAHPAWHFPSGGWLNPASLAQARLARAGDRCQPLWQNAVDRLVRGADGLWHALRRDGSRVASAPVVVLANALGAQDLVRGLSGRSEPPWPLRAVRGQLSWLDSDRAPPAPRLPVAGTGYLLPSHGGRVAFGATSDDDDLDPHVRPGDHQRNLARVAALSSAWQVDPLRLLGDGALGGRTAWRCVAADRLPLMGGVPLALTQGATVPARGRDQPIRIPRAPGLFVFTALGSRGIAWSGLGARVLVAAITGSPAPLENSLLDAIDPARFLARAARHTGGGAGV